MKGRAALALIGVALPAAACTTAPMIGMQAGESLANPAPVTYRDLATIPDRPEPSTAEQKERSVKDLTEDRDAAMRAAIDLREAPFAAPEPVLLSRPDLP